MRKMGAVLSALLLVGALAGCGEKTDSGTPSSSSSTSSGAEAATNLVALAKSVGDQTVEQSTAHMVFTADAAGEKVQGEGDIRVGGEDVAIQMDMDTSAGSMSLVLVDGLLYFKLPQEIEPGKSWIKIDPNDTNNPIAQQLGSLTEQMQQSADPRKTLEQFQESGEITDTKEEELDGKQTTHYSITVDAQKLADQQGDPATKAEMQKAVDAGLKEIPVELWVDEDNLPVRVSMDMPAGASSVKVQVDYSNWGQPVDITAPPAEQIGELPA